LRKGGGGLHAPDRLGETRPALHGLSFDEVGGVSGVPTEPQLKVAQVVAGVVCASRKRRLVIKRPDSFQRSIGSRTYWRASSTVSTRVPSGHPT
jgi:hypothetical protein